MGACLCGPMQSRRRIVRIHTYSDKIESAHPDRSYKNPSFQGTAEFFDARSHDSDEFYSVCEGLWIYLCDFCIFFWSRWVFYEWGCQECNLRVSEGYSKELPSRFQESISRLINDEVERVGGFPVDTVAAFRNRLTILRRLANTDDLQLSSAERKLVNSYKEKPVLSQPQHEFYLGENYLEVDIDVHRFSYVARKGLEAFQNRLNLCTLDFGLTIQGNKAEDLPENMLCCIRLNKLDPMKCKIFGC
ncbi:uncharacterized protein [Euphorbia lathyris]|uniref:uncharacterized protein isoform X2 n=1 Tax=Euphorbia lathyris TaxID=212925 RepID=UPI0033140C6A